MLNKDEKHLEIYYKETIIHFLVEKIAVKSPINDIRSLLLNLFIFFNVLERVHVV